MKTSDLAERLCDAFSGYEAARYNRMDPPCFITGPIRLMGNPLSLKQTEEAFTGQFITAMTDSTHAENQRVAFRMRW